MKHEYPNLPAFLIFDSRSISRNSRSPTSRSAATCPKTVPRADNAWRARAQARHRCRCTGEDRRALQRLCARPASDPDFRRGENQWKLASAKAAARRQCQPRHHRGAAVLRRRAASDRLGLGRAAGRQQRTGHPPAATADPRASTPPAMSPPTTEHGVGYQAGLSLASSMTFSYLAVRHMMAS